MWERADLYVSIIWKMLSRKTISVGLDPIPNNWLFTSRLSGSDRRRMQLDCSRACIALSILIEPSNTSSSLCRSSSAAIRFMDRPSHSMHKWININSPRLHPYLLLLSLRVSPSGCINPLQAESRSPASCKSRCRDHRQYGQWLRFRTPASPASADTKLWQ